MSLSTEQSSIRLAELVASLSLGTDLGLGQSMEHVQRQCLIALQLCDRLELAEEDRQVVYYSGLLAWIGCHIDAYEQAKWFGDDISLKIAFRHVDGPGMGFIFRHLGSGRPALERARTAIAFIGKGRPAAEDMLENHWIATEHLARSLGLGDDVCASLEQTFERWDGKGAPAGRAAEEILITSRLVNLADVVEVYHRNGGVEAARSVARDRSGSQFDPEVVDLFCEVAPDIFTALDSESGWDAVIEAEPTLKRCLDETEFDLALEAIADFTDLKSPWTMGHSLGVADLAAGAAAANGMPEQEVVRIRRAALLHDLGRLGISNSIWDKPGPLATSELERVRLYPYLGERMLAHSAVLAPLGSLAVQHHERLDGSGYPRGLSAEAISPSGRILGAADAYQAMIEPRPHREALAPEEAVAELHAEVRAGRLDADAVDAVLGAAGHRVRSRREGPAGLTPREIEVLGLLARGLSNREIAENLVISPKTASNHIEHIYSKTGVTNRARASLFAVKHGLIADEAELVPD